ncbi:MAG: PP2C family protein-serine/threonine phosphatase [Cyclobacteriaceae bacterium]|nr:PP2C family protein-serine/threonine phosphatase [Cyclobacteriaceae bacterium]
MDQKSLEDKLKLKELELNAVLEITKAINDNLPEDALYKIYDFTLRANLNIKKLALYVLDDHWNCKVNHGTKADFFKIKMNEELTELKKIKQVKDCKISEFEEFEYIIPVFHKNETLALIFVSEDREDEHNASEFIQAISNIIIVAIENKKLARRELDQEAFRKELEIASDVQQFLFPDDLPYGVRLKVEASYLPHDRVGGDYYDYIPINKNQFLICVADVSGKGIPAAILMSNFQASLRTLIRQTPNLTEIIEALNFQIMDSAKGEKFITFFAGIYDHNLKTLVYVNSGHNPPILVRNNGNIELLEEGSTILGMFQPLPFINEGFITDLDDFLLLCYTDGVTETSNEQGEEYGVERLSNYLTKNANKDLKEIHQDIIVNLDNFKGKEAYNDDITILSCRID